MRKGYSLISSCNIFVASGGLYLKTSRKSKIEPRRHTFVIAHLVVISKLSPDLRAGFCAAMPVSGLRGVTLAVGCGRMTLSALGQRQPPPQMKIAPNYVETIPAEHHPKSVALINLLSAGSIFTWLAAQRLCDHYAERRFN